MAIPNGHLFGGGGLGSGSMSDSGMPPSRPLYPRTQYSPQPMPPLNPPYASSTPRVNLTSGDLSAPSSGKEDAIFLISANSFNSFLFLIS